MHDESFFHYVCLGKEKICSHLPTPAVLRGQNGPISPVLRKYNISRKIILKHHLEGNIEIKVHIHKNKFKKKQQEVVVTCSLFKEMILNKLVIFSPIIPTAKKNVYTV